MLAALQERTQYRPTNDSALEKWFFSPGSSLVPGETMYSPHSPETWVVRIVESCWSSANRCLLTFQKWEKDLGIPHRSWLTDGNPLCGWARATSQTSIWSTLTKRLYARATNDDSPSTAGQKKTFEQLSKHHRGRRRRLRTFRLRLNLSLFLTHHKKRPRMRRKNLRRRRAGGANGHKRNTRSVELKQKRDAHRDTRECVRTKKSDDEITEAATT